MKVYAREWIECEMNRKTDIGNISIVGIDSDFNRERIYMFLYYVCDIKIVILT